MKISSYIEEHSSHAKDTLMLFWEHAFVGAGQPAITQGAELIKKMLNGSPAATEDFKKQLREGPTFGSVDAQCVIHNCYMRQNITRLIQIDLSTVHCINASHPTQNLVCSYCHTKIAGIMYSSCNLCGKSFRRNPFKVSEEIC